ncbi:hypothetical protein [Pseudomonas sp. R5(2019)]|uniref:hypothetical protein n=1 Tax=Pseudomonas sp. R5(2019) TaxID=2697566 RepID=UPI001412FA23|nr:hypothetical protein [Pseudomonas sp. R5(2019)]NBA93446.1 hypothetical protein [Pseudomonas sp. R5(2019)]
MAMSETGKYLQSRLIRELMCEHPEAYKKVVHGEMTLKQAGKFSKYYSAPEHPKAGKDKDNELQYHPFANLFPMMEGEQYEALKADIAANGVREPVLLYGNGDKGGILEGRARSKAATELDVPCHYEYFHGTQEEALEYVYKQKNGGGV